jgi:hypothetical protein
MLPERAIDLGSITPLLRRHGEEECGVKKLALRGDVLKCVRGIGFRYILVERSLLFTGEERYRKQSQDASKTESQNRFHAVLLLVRILGI